MEPANIDWKNIKSIIIEDDIYEHINAPKWIDFSALEDSVDDNTETFFFCKPDCQHPKTVEDFKSPEILPLGNRNCRDARLKRRVPISVPNEEDCENENPNLFSTPPNRNHNKPLKIKSSAESKKNKQVVPSLTEDSWRENERGPELKRTLSSRSLVVGKEILNHITEFCNELKKLAMRIDDKENAEKLNVEKKVLTTEVCCENLRDNGKEEKKQLVEKGKCDIEVKSNAKEKQRTIRRNEATENIKVFINSKKAVDLGGGNSLPVRTNPPSPQCFSATRGPLRPIRTTTTPLKPHKSRPTEKGVLQEQNKRVASKTFREEGKNKSISVAAATTEGRSLDVFWFLKPCTNVLSS